MAQLVIVNVKQKSYLGIHLPEQQLKQLDELRYDVLTEVEDFSSRVDHLWEEMYWQDVELILRALQERLDIPDITLQQNILPEWTLITKPVFKRLCIRAERLIELWIVSEPLTPARNMTYQLLKEVFQPLET